MSYQHLVLGKRTLVISQEFEEFPRTYVDSFAGVASLGLHTAEPVEGHNEELRVSHMRYSQLSLRNQTA